MIALDLINEMIPPLKLLDSGEKAKHWMDELHLSQLPVIDKGAYLGMLLEDTLLESDSLNKPIESFRLVYKDIYIQPQTHYYDIIKTGMKNKLSILPVIDDKNKFIGVVSINTIAVALAEMIAAQSTGGIILLEMKETDYSLAEISRLIESNDCKILSSFLVSDEQDASKIRVTLKLNKTDLSRTIATLERYGYNVVSQYQDADSINNDQERLDQLMKYLNM